MNPEYAPPDLGVGNPRTTYTYNRDRQLTLVTRPDGQGLTLAYDGGGRLSTLTEPRGQTRFSYDPPTGQLARIATPECGLGDGHETRKDHCAGPARLIKRGPCHASPAWMPPACCST